VVAGASSASSSSSSSGGSVVAGIVVVAGHVVVVVAGRVVVVEGGTVVLVAGLVVVVAGVVAVVAGTLLVVAGAAVVAADGAEVVWAAVAGAGANGCGGAAVVGTAGGAEAVADDSAGVDADEVVPEPVVRVEAVGAGAVGDALPLVTDVLPGTGVPFSADADDAGSETVNGIGAGTTVGTGVDDADVVDVVPPVSPSGRATSAGAATRPGSAPTMDVTDTASSPRDATTSTWDGGGRRRRTGPVDARPMSLA
jgi:hypothetical protein